MRNGPRSLAYYLTTEDRGRLIRIRKFAVRVWAKEARRYPFFTLHGALHSAQVEAIVNDILRPWLERGHSIKNILSPSQLFYLLASAWLHDTGMLVPPTKSERQAAKKQGISVHEWIRAEHHKRSKKYVMDQAAKLGLDEGEALIVGSICEAHRKTILTEAPESYPNVRLLGAVLRAADELDLTRNRAPKEQMELLWTRMDRTSRWHWLKHYCVSEAKACYSLRNNMSGSLSQLAYEYVVRLPDQRFKAAFESELMRPIRKVLEAENVNLILQTIGIKIGCGQFGFTPLIGDEPVVKETTLRKSFNSLLPVPVLLPPGVRPYLPALRRKMPAIAKLLTEWSPE